MSLSGAIQIFGSDTRTAGATQLHKLGQLGATADGRRYRYTENGATALVAGQLCVAADITANHEDLVVNTAAIGDKTLTVTLGNTAIVANDYDGGYVNVLDDNGQGVVYLIDSAPVTAGNGTVIIELHEPIVVAFEANTTVTLIRNSYKEVVVSDNTQADLPVGVPNFAIPINEFGWLQTGGTCSILVDTNDTTAGQPITIGAAVNGAVETHNAATEVIVGRQPAGTNGAAAEYGIYDLTID